MILDITFKDGKGPKQYQKVKSIEFAYETYSSLIVKFYDSFYSEMTIAFDRILGFKITND